MSALGHKLLRDLRRQRTQSLAIALTVLVGTALSVVSADAYRNLEASYARVFELLHTADLWVSGGDVEGFAREALTHPAVALADVRVVADVPVRVGERRFLGRLVGAPANGSAIDDLLVSQGEALDAAAPDGVLVEEHFARHDELSAGAHIEVLGREGWRAVDVRGVAASAEYLWPARSRQDILPAPGTFGVVFASDALARRLAGSPNEAAVRLASGAPAGALDELAVLARAHGGTLIVHRADQVSNATLRADIDGFRSMALMFPFLFLGTAALAAGVLLGRRVRAERSVIGTLRALGMSRRSLLRHYLVQGSVLGLAGALPGALLGHLLARTVTSSYTAAIDVPVTVVESHPETIALAVVIGLLTGLLGAWGPARAAARVSPAQAMRGAVPDTEARGGTMLERLLPPLRRAPVRVRLVLRSLGRNRRRSLTTALGVVSAATLVLVSWGMLDSTEHVLARQFEDITQADATVYLRGAPSEDTLAAVTAVQGVDRVEPLVELPVVLAAGDARYATVLQAYELDTHMHRFLDGSRRLALPDDGVLLGSALRAQLGLEVGSELTAATPGGLVLRLRVGGFVDEPLGTFAYAALPMLERLTGGGVGPNAYAIDLAADTAEPAARAEVLARVDAVEGVAVSRDLRALAAVARDYMGLFYAFVGMMLVFGGAMAFAILFTTMSANIAERQGEIATLRAAGIAHRKIARLVTAENLLVTALGVAPGLVLGALAAYGFMESFSTDLFQMPLHLRPTTPLCVGLALLLVALASQWPGLRAVRRLDIARVVRERSQ